MAVVKMFIEKFGKEVLIDEDHPLAVAEKAKADKPRRKRRSEQPEA